MRGVAVSIQKIAVNQALKDFGIWQPEKWRKQLAETTNPASIAIF
jgi:hypothetical protein